MVGDEEGTFCHGRADVYVMDDCFIGPRVLQVEFLVEEITPGKRIKRSPIHGWSARPERIRDGTTENVDNMQYSVFCTEKKKKKYVQSSRDL